MNAIFLAIRVPFFVVGVILWTLFAIFLWALGAIVGILALPFKFLQAAFENDKKVITAFVREQFGLKEWLGVYVSMYHWLLGKSR